MERLKVRESDTIRFLFLARFFLEFFLLVYHDDEKRGIPHDDEEKGHDFGLVAEMTEPHAIGFVTMRMKTALEEKVRLKQLSLRLVPCSYSWERGTDDRLSAVCTATTLHRPPRRRRVLYADGASSPCPLPFLRSCSSPHPPQLHIIEALQATSNPDHVDVAEILQNKLYYEADTLDMVLTLIHKYNGQSYRFVSLPLTHSVLALEETRRTRTE
jgi:replication fork protection complex subunit Tof1/Swi1